jgi:hypothetical protein
VVLAVRALTAEEVVVMFVRSTTVVPNAGSVDTCRWYDVAPVEAFHVSVGFVATPVVPLAGVASAGGEGGGRAAVVKFQAAEYALVPPVFAALTCQ